MDALSKIRNSILLVVSLGTAIFQMGCVPPPPALKLQQEIPELVVDAGTQLNLQYTLNSPLARNKSLFFFADEFLIRHVSYSSSDIFDTIDNTNLGKINGIPLTDVSTYCDPFAIRCWAKEHIDTVTVRPIANTTYTLKVLDRTGEWPYTPDGNLWAQLLNWVIDTPQFQATYEKSVDVEVNRDILITSIPSINTNNYLWWLPRPPNFYGNPLWQCINQYMTDYGATMTSEVTDLDCTANNLRGIQFFYNLSTLKLTSSGTASEANLRFLEYLTDVPSIDLTDWAEAATLNGCQGQRDIRDTLAPGVVTINPACEI